MLETAQAEWAERVDALVKLLRAGAGDRVVVSHDSVWCWRGQPFPPEAAAGIAEVWNPSHFSRRIVPKLEAAGISGAEIDALVVDNPRRFFAGEKLAALERENKDDKKDEGGDKGGHANGKGEGGRGGHPYGHYGGKGKGKKGW